MSQKSPQSIDETILQHLREQDADAKTGDGVPEPLEDVPTAPMRIDAVWREPDFDEEDPTLVVVKK